MAMDISQYSGFTNRPDNSDDVFQKQLASMAETLRSGNVNLAPVDNRTWLEKFFNLLNRPLGATTSILSAASPDRTLGEGFKQAGQVLAGKKTYGTHELLQEAFGKSDKIGRKIAEFGLGIPLDPLTWIPLAKAGKAVGKVAKPLIGAGANAARAAGYADKVADVKRGVEGLRSTASAVKGFFGYDDFARFAGKEAFTDPITGKVIAAVPDRREAAMAIKQIVGSNTSRRGVFVDEYMQSYSGLQKLLGGLGPDEKIKFMDLIELRGKKAAAAIPTASTKIQNAVESYRGLAKKLGDEQASLGLIEDITGAGWSKAGLPKRIGGASSEGYIKHAITKQFKDIYPTLESIPDDTLREAARPFYEIGSKKVYSRKLTGTINDLNMKSQMATMDKFGGQGIKMFEDDPMKIMNLQLEDMANIKAQSDIVKAIKGLKDANGNPILQGFDDETINSIAQKYTTTKVAGKQPFAKYAGDQAQKQVEAIKKAMEATGTVFPEGTTSRITKGLSPLSNPLFKETGKIIAAPDEIAKIINKLSPNIPGESPFKILRSVDKVVNVWKKLAITNPKFHINNWFGATSNNLLDDAWNTITKRGLMKEIGKGGTGKIYDLGALKGTADDILKVFKESGATSGWTKAEVFAKNPISKIGKFSSKVGGDIETQVRLQAFINSLSRGKSVPEAIQRVFQIHGNYSPEAFSVFEKEVVKRVLPFYCVPDTSSILTRVGWKTVDTLVVGEDALTYSLKNDCLEWKPVLDIATFDYDQDIRIWKNKRHKLSFTSEHRWVSEQRGYKDTSKKIVPSTELNSHSYIKVASKYLGNGSGSLSEDDAQLLGWLLTDGYFRWRGNCCEAVIYQSPKKHLIEVTKIAGGKPRKPHPDTGVVCVPVTHEKLSRIKHLLHRNKQTNNWVDVVTSLSAPAMEKMYEAMMKGDGNYGKKSTSIACQLDGVADTFEVLATLLGKRVVRNSKGFYISDIESLGINYGKFSNEHYFGRVWCPKTENETWVMKQGKFITITGNTWTKTSVPFQLQTFINKTGIYSNIAHSQDIIKGENGGEELPAWLRSRILIGTKKTADGKAVARQLPISLPDLEMFSNPSNVMLSKLNPLLKIPLELGLNKDTFFDSKLFDPNKYSQEGKKVPMSKQYLDYAMKQIPLITAGKSAKNFADTELKSVGMDPNVINYLMAVIAGQVDPTAPKEYDPAREKYAQQSTQAEMMRNLIGNLRRNGIIPPAK